MSGLTCTACGRGPVEGWSFAWGPRGRLLHKKDGSDPRTGFGCVQELGVAEGMARCSLGGEAFMAKSAVLGEVVMDFDGGANGDWRPRRYDTEPFYVRFDVEPSIPDDEEWDEYWDAAVPTGTKGYVAEKRDDGSPYVACFNHAREAFAEARLVLASRGRPGGRGGRARPRGALSSGSTEKAAEGGAEARLAKLREVVVEPMSVADIAAKVGEDAKTVQRDLKAAGATFAQEGRSKKWSLPAQDSK